MIERRKQGREVFISFRAEPLRQVAGWMHEYERFWNERLDNSKLFQGKKEKKEKKVMSEYQETIEIKLERTIPASPARSSMHGWIPRSRQSLA